MLTAYGFGLIAIVLIRCGRRELSVVGDTKTPMLISLFAVGVNVALKVLLFRPFGAVGLAAATATGAWINLLLLMGLASQRGLMRLDWVFGKSAAATSVASFALALFALAATWPAARFCAGLPRFQNEAELVLLLAAGAIVYGVVLGAGLFADGRAVAAKTRSRLRAKRSNPSQFPDCFVADTLLATRLVRTAPRSVPCRRA